MKKTLVSIILIFALAATMVACNNSGNEWERTFPDYGYFHRYDNTVNLSIGQVVDKPYTYFGNERVGDNAVYALWEDVLNVNLSVKLSGSSADISSMVKYHMYDDDIPDISSVSEVMFDELYEQQMITDLTPYYEKYASPNLKHILEYNTMDLSILDGKTEQEKEAMKQINVLASSYKDGKLYAIPKLIDKYSFLPFVYVRTDWLKALAQKDFSDQSRYLELMPTTKTELINLSYRFKNEIKPLVNYTGNVYPLYSNDINFLYQMFGATLAYYEQDENKDWTYSTHKPEMLNAINEIRKLIADGIVDDRVFTEESSAVNVVKNGGCGIYIGRFWQPMQDIVDAARLIDGSDWEVTILYDDEGEVISPYSRPNLVSYYVVSDNCRNPEALFFMLNHIVEGSFDPNATYSKRLGDLMLDPKYEEVAADLWEWAPVIFDVPDKNYFSSLEVLDAIDKGTGKSSLSMPSSHFVYEKVTGFTNNPNPKTNTYNWTYYKIYKEVVPLMIEYNNKINYGGYHGTATERMVAKAVTIGNYEQTELIRFLTSNNAITQSQFNTFVSQHRTAGCRSIARIKYILQEYLEMTEKKAFDRKFNKFFKGEWQLYAMLALPLALLVIFNYIPMAGIRLAFVEKYIVRLGIWGSEWGGLKWFGEMFKVPSMWQIIGNTLTIASLKVFIGFPIPIIFSLLLNEIARKKQKSTIQTLIYLPYFLSWVVLGTIIFQLFGSQGAITVALSNVGINLKVFTDSNQFVTMIVASDLWKTFGFSTVVYLASLTGIDKGLYEAAEIDGANRFKQTIYVTLPGIMPIVMLIGILNLGNVLNAGFEQIYALYNPLVFDRAEIIDTFVYKQGILANNEELATAVGLFKGVISAILIITINIVCVKTTDYRVF